MVTRPKAASAPADRQPNDHELIRICHDPQDDRFEAAFETLFARYRDRVYSIALRMTGRTTDALDVVQDAFSVLFRKIGSFRRDAQFSTWLYRIVVNCSIDHQRRETSKRTRHASSLHSIEPTAEPVDDHDGPEASAASAELGRHVHDAVQSLSPKLRAVLVLRYMEGLSYEELAETLDISLGTVKSRLARAHVAAEGVLADTLDAYGYEPEPTDPTKSDEEVA